MRTTLLITLLAVSAAAAPADAQTIGAPALPEGSTRELTFAVTQPHLTPNSTYEAGFAVSYQRLGRVNLAGRVAYHDNLDAGQYAEIGTFGALPLPRTDIVDMAWNAGVGYAADGPYLPAGLTVSRAFQLRAVTLTPFAHGRLSLAGIDLFDGEAGNVHAAQELGVDASLGSSWSLRAGIGVVDGVQQLVLGFAHRR